MRATFDMILTDQDRQLGYSLVVDVSLDESGNLDTIDRVRLVGGAVFFHGWPTSAGVNIAPRDEHAQQTAGAAILAEMEEQIVEAVQSQITRQRDAAPYDVAERMAELAEAR